MKYFIIFLTILSCTQRAEITTNHYGDTLTQIETNIKSIREIKWPVGTKKEKEISQGLSITFAIPQISKKTINHLGEKYNIDSFIFELKRTDGFPTMELGYISVPLQLIHRNLDQATIEIYYPGAAVNSRIRSFHCPPIGHNLKLRDFSLIKKNPDFQDSFITKTEKVASEVVDIKKLPYGFSSGNRTLYGTYEMSVALYNSKQKQLYSRWLTLNKAITIKSEEEISIPSCTGINPMEIDELQKADIKLENFQIR